MKPDLKIIVAIALISLAVLGGGIYLLSKSSSSNNNQQVTDPKYLIREDSFKVATSSATVTLVEFSDFQCPACAVADPITRQLIKDYQGKMNFVYRHFPLPQHNNAEIAAEAVEAAGEQGKFLEMSEKVFATQSEWSNHSRPLEKFLELASELNLNIDQFKQAVENKKFADKIRRDKEDALILNINATPTFYINGQKYNGGLDYSGFKTEIDQALSMPIQ